MICFKYLAIDCNLFWFACNLHFWALKWVLFDLKKEKKKKDTNKSFWVLV